MLQNLSLLLLIVGFELLTAACGLGRGYYSNRLLQREGQDALGSKLDVGLFACGLNAATSASSGDRTDRRAFTSAENSAEDGARSRPNANLGCCVLAA